MQFWKLMVAFYRQIWLLHHSVIPENFETAFPIFKIAALRHIGFLNWKV